MAILQALRERHTCRAFDTSQDVPWELVEVLLETANLAPSGGNTQPWHLYVTWQWNVGKEPVLLRFFFVGCFALDLFEELLQSLGPVGEDFESRPTLDCIGVLWRVFFNPRWFTVHKLMSHA